ncbi:LAMI_0H13146g1_1 [Lachancea mirantina]|uniref:LAMI_0H13146g1_1 n=1 Tax=Lachancea mirantina TaxID=1230905 RepID=A0A1G4KI29_9SACH|nr:LAMI_0H13146g1_1 [Lachancea mirantina]
MKFSKLSDLVKTSQFAWFAGHVVVLFCSLLYAMTAFRRGNSGLHNVLYRMAYVGVIESFGIILYQQHLGRGNGTKAPLQSLLREDNVLYVILAVMWLLTPRLTITLVPYVVFSLFHVLTYVKSVVLPQLSEQGQPSRLKGPIDNFVRENNGKSMLWVSFAELVCLLLVLVRALLCYRSSWLVLLVFSAFIKIRYETSPHMRSCVKKWEVHVDGLVSHPQVPARVKGFYVRMKNQIRCLNKYSIARGSSAPTDATKQK